MTGPALERLHERADSLLAKRAKGRALDEFAIYADNPVGFIREVLKGETWSKLEEIAELVRDHPFTVVQTGNGLGKDWLAARLALWWVYARRGLVLVTGPTERQVRQVVMGELARAWGAAKDLPGELFELSLRLGRSEHAGVLAFTGGDINKVSGLHAPRLLVLATEAQGLEPWVWEGLQGCLTGEDSRFHALGNPLSPSGRFFEVCRAPHWRKVKLSAFDHPNLIEQREVIPGAVTQGFVDRMAREYGKDSPQYVARVLGEFPDVADDVLVKREWIRGANDLWAKIANTDESWRDPWVLGIDIARYGGDRTVIAVMQGRIVRQLIPLPPRDTMETVGLVHRQCVDRRIRHSQEGVSFGDRDGRLVCDAAGLGAGVHDRLRQMGYSCVEFNGGRSATELDRADFANLRAEGYWKLREGLERGEVAFPKHEALEEELLATRWTQTVGGKIAIESKDLIRERLGRSPDYADAVSMAVWEHRRRKLTSLPLLITL